MRGSVSNLLANFRSIPYVYPAEFEFTGDTKFPPSNYYITKDVPPCAPHDWTGEGNGFTDLHVIKPPIIAHDFQKNLSSLCTAVPLEKQEEMKRSYLSCIQYVDHLVGQLVTALKTQGLYYNTHIIFWGDHGYKLGEHCDWFKVSELLQHRKSLPVCSSSAQRDGLVVAHNIQSPYPQPAARQLRR